MAHQNYTSNEKKKNPLGSDTVGNNLNRCRKYLCFNLILIIPLILVLGSCGLFSSSDHIDAYGYELEVGGVVIALYDAGPGTFTIPAGTGFDYDGKLAIGSQVLNDEGYTNVITIHFWDRDGNRQEIDKFEEDGGDGDFLLGWNDQIGRLLNLGPLKFEKLENETWKFRIHTEERGNTAPENAGSVVFEIWHIDHSDFTALPLELYVLTEYEE